MKLPNRIVIAQYPIDVILPQIYYKKGKISLSGYLVNRHSLRLQVFKRDFNEGIFCKNCGKKANKFSLEYVNIHEGISDYHRVLSGAKSKFPPHLNLYGVDDDGTDLLFTKDHIIPLAAGGLDALENLQVLCSVCNNVKGSKL